MTSPSIIKVPCECGALARVNELGSGTISTSCPDCKSQAFYKSPKAVAAFRAKYAAAAEPAPKGDQKAAPAKAGSLLEDL